MLRRFFTLASAVSLLLFAATIVLWVRSYHVGERWTVARTRGYSIESAGGSVRLSLVTCYRVVNELAVGKPETRTLSAHSNEWTCARQAWEQPTPPDDRLFGAARNEDERGAAINAGGWVFVRTDERVSYVQAPHWLFAGILLLPAAACGTLRRRQRRTARSSPLCAVCGYDLRASSNRCPECGTPVSRNSGTPS